MHTSYAKLHTLETPQIPPLSRVKHNKHSVFKFYSSFCSKSNLIIKPLPRHIWKEKKELNNHTHPPFFNPILSNSLTLQCPSSQQPPTPSPVPPQLQHPPLPAQPSVLFFALAQQPMAWKHTTCSFANRPHPPPIISPNVNNTSSLLCSHSSCITSSLPPSTRSTGTKQPSSQEHQLQSHQIVEIHPAPTSSSFRK